MGELAEIGGYCAGLVQREIDRWYNTAWPEWPGGFLEFSSQRLFLLLLRVWQDPMMPRFENMESIHFNKFTSFRHFSFISPPIGLAIE